MKEVIVIGAGIVGSSTAYHLAKAGSSVTIIDRGEPGQATQAGAGIICPWLTNRSNKAWYQLVLAGARYYPSLVEGLKADGETDTGYKRVGAINIFDTDEKLDKKYQLALTRRAEAPEMGEVMKLDSKETNELFPVLDDSYQALHISGGARVNGHKVNQALLRAAINHGAEYVQGNAQLHVENGKAKGVKVDDETLYSDQVVVANGAWANELFQSVGLRSNVTFEKAQILHLQLPTENTSEWPVLLPPFGHYQLGFDSGRVVIGATKEKRNDYDTRVTMGAVHELLEKALKVSPGLKNAEYVGTKVGFRPFTKGSLPAIGQVPDHDNVWLVNGMGASGLTSGPYVGAEVAKMVSGNQPELDVNHFGVERIFH
ncbi:FAD-binding oxidoreductase [Halobacillus litoralis]|uniref:NAD(P)/FAD-dependent oxidoreductase n=1 Tax=Halobacillus litoralis TaxID=45668 RepID=UPI001CD5BF26|nr:FAD-dependent oxidoreductase [Halobacillus litoralis]MCA0970263.1 FAD-binding oxidoreductase [Halobacillus litoralis]